MLSSCQLRKTNDTKVRLLSLIPKEPVQNFPLSRELVGTCFVNLNRIKLLAFFTAMCKD